MFFKTESWNFQKLFENEFRETSQSFNLFSYSVVSIKRIGLLKYFEGFFHPCSQLLDPVRLTIFISNLDLGHLT